MQPPRKPRAWHPPWRLLLPPPWGPGSWGKWVKGPRAREEQGPAGRAAGRRARWGSERPAMAPPPGRRPRPRCGGREEGRGRRGLYKARGGRRSFVFCCSNASGSPGAADWKRNFSVSGSLGRRPSLGGVRAGFPGGCAGASSGAFSPTGRRGGRATPWGCGAGCGTRPDPRPRAVGNAPARVPRRGAEAGRAEGAAGCRPTALICPLGLF